MTALPFVSPRMPTPAADNRLFSTLVASRPAGRDRTDLVASLASIALHAAAIALLVWATMRVSDVVLPDDTLVIDLTAPTPMQPVAPAPLVTVAPPDIDVADVTSGPIRLSPPTVILPDIPLPGGNTAFDPDVFTRIGPEGDASGASTGGTGTEVNVAAGPTFTPMTLRPTIRNFDEVARALQRYYPALLRDAGVGGTVVVWILIDEAGNVVRTQLFQSSGHAALDDAALRVGEVIEFTPARNRDRAVPVWIQWPITFRSR